MLPRHSLGSNGSAWIRDILNRIEESVGSPQSPPSMPGGSVPPQLISFCSNCSSQGRARQNPCRWRQPPILRFGPIQAGGRHISLLPDAMWVVVDFVAFRNLQKLILRGLLAMMFRLMRGHVSPSGLECGVIVVRWLTPPAIDFSPSGLRKMSGR